MPSLSQRPLCGDLTFQVFAHEEAGKGVVIFSPCKFSAAMKDEFNALGGVKGIVVPHAFHTAFVAAYLEEWPELTMYCGPGLNAEVSSCTAPTLHHCGGDWCSP